MSNETEKAKSIRERLALRLPEFKDGIGAGDIVHAVTHALGIEHCSECARRKEALNRVLRFKSKLGKEPKK